jgi:hypothetical protein
MDPKDLSLLVSDWEDHPDTFTLGSEDNTIMVVNYSLPDDDQRRADHLATAFHMMEILEDVQGYIPPFRAVFSVHDNPNLHTDYELKTLALKAASSGKCTEHAREMRCFYLKLTDILLYQISTSRSHRPSNSTVG